MSASAMQGSHKQELLVEGAVVRDLVQSHQTDGSEGCHGISFYLCCE